MSIGLLVDLMLGAGADLEVRRSSGGGRVPADTIWTLEQGRRGDLEWCVKKGRRRVVHVEKGRRLLQRASGGWSRLAVDLLLYRHRCGHWGFAKEGPAVDLVLRE
jgi:hypothetical protein